MQAIPTTHMILPEGILSTIDGTQLIPVSIYILFGRSIKYSNVVCTNLGRNNKSIFAEELPGGIHC